MKYAKLPYEHRLYGFLTFMLLSLDNAFAAVALSWSVDCVRLFLTFLGVYL